MCCLGQDPWSLLVEVDTQLSHHDESFSFKPPTVLELFYLFPQTMFVQLRWEITKCGQEVSETLIAKTLSQQ
jgi:hypothetical protein